MKKQLFNFKRGLLTVAALVFTVSGFAQSLNQSVTDAEYEAANASITDGATYTISTVYNGTADGDITYYLDGAGYLTTDASKAGQFTFAKQDEPDGFKPTACRVKKFTNVAGGKTSTEWENHGHLNQNGPRAMWESQVFFMKDDKYAIRSTNATGSEWGPDCYWTVIADATLPQAGYNLTAGKADFIWTLTKTADPSTISFDNQKAYTATSQGNKNYQFLSPLYTSDHTNLHFTTDATKAMRLYITATDKGDNFYLYDLRSGYYVVPAVDKNNGTAWTVSKTPTAVKLTIEGTTYYLSGENSGNANPYNAKDGRTIVGNYPSGGDSKWAIVAAEGSLLDNTLVEGVRYALQTCNSKVKNKYISGVKKIQGETTNTLGRVSGTTADATHFVIAKNGDNYTFKADGTSLYITPSADKNNGTYWTLGENAADVVVALDNNNSTVSSLFAPAYTLSGTNGGYANAYNGDNTSNTNLIVANWPATNDVSSHWLIVPVTDLDVTITEDKFATFASGLDTNYSGLSVTPKTGTVNGNTLTFADQKLVKGGTGVVLYSENAGTYTVPVDYTSTATEVSNDLVGVLVDTEISAPTNGGIYILSKVDDVFGFYKISGKGTILANKAYLKVNDTNAKYFSLDGTATAIEQALVAPLLDKNAPVYNLQGQRVARPAHGIFIQNGKKFVVK